MTEEASTTYPKVNAGPFSTKVTGLFGGENMAKKYRRWLQFEVVALCVLMVIVWGLLSIPIIIFYFPPAVNATVSVIAINCVTITSLFLHTIVQGILLYSHLGECGSHHGGK